MIIKRCYDCGTRLELNWDNKLCLVCDDFWFGGFEFGYEDKI